MSDKPTHKVIGVDKLNRADVSDRLICGNCSEYWAKQIADALNEKSSDYRLPIYFKAVPAKHKLYRYEP